mgnify:FL=1
MHHICSYFDRKTGDEITTMELDAADAYSAALELEHRSPIFFGSIEVQKDEAMLTFDLCAWHIRPAA